MNNLLVILLSFYPSTFLYSTLLAYFKKNIEALAPLGVGNFVVHLVLFAIVFFVVHSVFKKLLSFGYLGGSKRGFVGISIMTLLTLIVAIITFYTVLPGSLVYRAPLFIQKYVLTEPYTLAGYIFPFIYLFF